MSANSLALIAGTFLSLLFSYVPGLNKKFAAVDPVYKRLSMLGLLALSAAAIYGLSCFGWALGGFEVPCDEGGIKQLIEVFIVAIIANQSIYTISPETKGVREARM